MKTTHSISPRKKTSPSVRFRLWPPAVRCFVGLLVFSVLATLSSAAPLDSNAFTYQGRLIVVDGGVPASGPFDLRFTLFTTASGGTSTNVVTKNETVANGLFTTTLDFGPNVFNGSNYWLEVAVRGTGLGEEFKTLLPRRLITSAPYALFAANAGTAASAGIASTATNANSVPWAGIIGKPQDLDDGDNDTTYSAGAGLMLTGTVFQVRFGTNSDVAARGDHVHAAEEITAGILNAARIDPLVARDAEVLPLVLAANAFWQLGGNNGVVPGMNFIGTTDTNALEFRVNSAVALRLEPHTNGPNVIGGANFNGIVSGVGAASIGGGAVNHISANYAHVGGGRDNRVLPNASYATIPGGFGARARSFGQVTHASGSYPSGFGEAQASVYVLRGMTVGAATNELFLDGSGARMIVPTNGVWTFDILVVAATANNAQTAGFKAQGIVKSNGSTMSLVGITAQSDMPIPGTIPPAGWKVEITVPNAVDPADNESALIIRGVKTGPSVGQIRWVATVRTAELIY